ncbi:hypothetical protein I4F81_000039 [Pyropia yezoensis]|uniref:Uncharacterized protein n=1 Tax=Pyropia yezoensis TaxID=2788 RepID=A0ACC3BI35_PYRYE|nr:hypothetical protein I4F81_000039 [Neopyropia yezoensis]
MPLWRPCADAAAAVAFAADVAAVRGGLPLDVDGVVVRLDDAAAAAAAGATARSPRAPVALKFAAAAGVTRLVGVDHQVSRAGVLMPVAVLAPPLPLGGVSVARATLHNYGRAGAGRLGVAVGALVTVARGGHVITKIVAVHAPPPGGVPVAPLATCPACRSPVHVTDRDGGGGGDGADGTAEEVADGAAAARDAAHAAAPPRRGGAVAVARCTNAGGCAAQVVGRVAHFGRPACVDICGLGAATARRLVDAGLVASPADLYALTADAVTAAAIPGLAVPTVVVRPTVVVLRVCSAGRAASTLA